MKVLSVDWDFFFPVPEFDDECLYDWGHNERMSLMINGIWTMRAAGFLVMKKELPLLSGDEKEFWKRFKFKEGAKLYYADSHCFIFRPEICNQSLQEVWNFDAHHDAYKSREDIIKSNSVSCESWATGMVLNGIKVKQFLPTWKSYSKEKPMVHVDIEVDPQKPFHKPFDQIFLCRSGAWTPTWLEENFWSFVESCPVSEKINMDGMTKRTFSLEEVETYQKGMQKVMEDMKKEYEAKNGVR